MPRVKDMGFDCKMGVLLRKARRESALTQDALGAIIGVSFQQVQKYEWGDNSITAYKLGLWASATGKPISYFLE